MGIKQDLQVITDTFTGADGGTVYVQLRALLLEMERRGDSDKAAVEIVKLIRAFGRLCKLYSK